MDIYSHTEEGTEGKLFAVLFAILYTLLSKPTSVTVLRSEHPEDTGGQNTIQLYREDYRGM